MPVTIVHVLGTLDRGGAETVTLDLCRRIPATEVRQRVLLLGEHEGSLAGQFRGAGVEIERCPLRPWPTFLPRLWHRLRADPPDVVTSHVSLFSGPVLAIAAAAGVANRIARLHSEGDGRPSTRVRRLYRAALRAVLRRSATAVLGVTTATLAFACPPPGDPRYRVVPNGVDTERFRLISHRPPEPVLVHIGRAAPEKNRNFAVRIHRAARRIEPRTRLVLAGPGGTHDLEPLALRDPAIAVTGEVDRVEEVLAKASVLVLPSHREGLPGVVLEALASGVPVLATDLPGLREVARRLPGLTVLPLGAGPDQWARTALLLATSSPVERRVISEAVRSSAYAAEECAQVWRQLWTSR